MVFVPAMGGLCYLRWVFPHPDPHAAEAHQLQTIHPERCNSCLASWGQTKNSRGICIPGKVLFPRLLLRVKQGDGREMMCSISKVATVSASTV